MDRAVKIKRIDVQVSSERHERLRQLAFENETSIQALATAVTEALADGLIKPHLETVMVPRKVVTFGKNGRRRARVD